MIKNKLLSHRLHGLFALILMAGMSLNLHAQQGIFVKSSSGSTTAISYNTVTKLTFVNEVMTVVSPAGVSGQTFSLANTSLISFGDVATDVDGFQANNVKLYPTITKTNLYLQGVPEGAGATIYSVNGSKIMQIKVQSATEAIDVSGLTSGLYMLRVNGETFKFYRQ